MGLLYTRDKRAIILAGLLYPILLISWYPNDSTFFTKILLIYVVLSSLHRKKENSTSNDAAGTATLKVITSANAEESKKVMSQENALS